jgi:hypothetical protein
VAITAFAEITLAARDPAALAEFYARSFGLPVPSRQSDRVWLAVGDRARLGIWKPGVKEFGDERGEHVHFAFAVAPGSFDVIARRLRSQSAPVERRSRTMAATARSTSAIPRAASSRHGICFTAAGPSAACRTSRREPAGDPPRIG